MINFKSYFILVNRFPLVVFSIFSWTWIELMKFLLKPELNLNYFLDTSLIVYLDLFSRTFSLGILLFLVLALFHETYLSYMNKTWIDTFGIGLLLLYVFSNFLLDSVTTSPLLIKQDYIFLMICLGMAFCVVPFFKFSMRSFWKFNNIIFIKLLKAFVYMSILGGCISLGLFLFDYFFDMFVSLWVYNAVFLICFGCFGSLYFLNQIPLNLSQFEEKTPLPKFYYLMARIYLVPFIYIFSFLFYIYLGLEFVQDFGVQAYLTPFFIVFLIINLFLILQVGLFDDKVHSSRLTRFYLKYSYFFIFPLVIYFFYWLSLSWFNYGITEFWYIIWIFIFGYIVISIYFIVSSQKDIRIIPVSLLIGCLLLSFSPVKPFHVAVNSQYSHFLKFLTQYDLLNKDMKFNFDNAQDLSLEKKYQLKDYLYFLDSHSSLYLLQNHYVYPITFDSITLSRISFDFGVLDI